MTKIRQMLLFAIVLILLVGVASASDVESDAAIMETSTTTSTSTAYANSVVQKDINTPIEDIQEKDIINEKEITKKDESNVLDKNPTENMDESNKHTIEKKTKDANLKKDNTIEVYNYTELRSAVANARSAGVDTTIRLLEGSYNTTDTISWSTNGIVLTIDGNGQTINGQGKRVFSIDNDANLVLKNITITNATSIQGGAISNNRATLNVKDSTFTNNHVTQNGWGGVIYNYNYGNLIVTDSTFTNNHANQQGYGGAINNRDGYLTITNSRFINNTASNNGGAIYNEYSYLTVTGSTFTNNRANDNGGAIYSNCGIITLTKSNFTNNQATNTGGALRSDRNPSQSSVEHLLDHSSSNINSSNFINNTAKNAAAIYELGPINIINNTFKENTAISNKETIVLGDGAGNQNRVFKNNTYESTDISLNEIKLTVNDDQTIYTTDEDVILNISIKPKISEYYKDFKSGIKDITIYINGQKNITTKYENYTLSGLEQGEYTVYFTSCNNQSNTVTFKVNADTEVNVTNYAELVQAIEQAKQERYPSYKINLLPGDYSATQNITLTDSLTKKIIINANGNVLDGKDTYKFIDMAAGHELTLENITITNYRGGYGGALSNNGTLIIIDSILDNNNATYVGGAVENRGTLIIKNSTLENNKAGTLGGAIYNNQGTLNISDNSVLQNNIAAIGGAVYNIGGSVYISSSVLENNNATDDGGAVSNQGSLYIIKSTLENNKANVRGGAIFDYYANSLSITDSTIQNNSASLGGAIYDLIISTTNTEVTLYNSNFTDNKAQNGSVIYNYWGYGKYNVTYNTFRNNTATLDNETLYFDEDKGQKILKENTYINTDIDMKTIILSRDEVPNYLLGEDVTLGFAVELEHPAYYDTDIMEKLYKTLYINGEENDSTLEYDYNLSDLPVGEYSVYFTAGNQESNTVTFKVNGNTEVNVTSYTELVQAIEHAKQERYTSYKINLLPGDYNATQNITLTDYATRNIIINGNSNVLDGKDTYQFMGIAAGIELTLENITITNYNAYTGGAIYNNGTLNLTDSTLQNSTANIHGGAIYNRGTLTITQSTLQNNKAEHNGGAIYNNYGTLTITQSTLQNNSAVEGGVIYNYYGNTTIINTILQNNKADMHGGAIYNEDRLTIIDSTLQNNKADIGGAIYNEDKLTIIDSTLQNNKADIGGAIYNYYSNTSIINSTLQNNTANRGGAIYDITHSTIDSMVALYNSNFTDNTAKNGSVICNEVGYGTYNITYNTFKNNLASVDNETLNLGANNKEITVEDNNYVSTDIDMKTIVLTRDEVPNYLLGEDVTLGFTMELEHPEYYDADILEKLNKTIYVNGDENDSTLQSDYVLSDLDVGEYNVYFIAGNQESNTLTFKVNDDMEVNVSSYTELVQAIEHAKQERYTSYKINLLPGDYNATQNITCFDSATKIIVINGNNNTLDGQETYQFIRIGIGLNLTIENITITNYSAVDLDNLNMDGGAIDNAGILTITDSTFRNNMAELYGGAIINGGTLTITDSTFENNYSGVGGAIGNLGTLIITNTTFENNTAINVGGAITNQETLTIIDSLFNNNNAEERGGAVSNDHGNLTIINSTLNNNKAYGDYGVGGAISNQYGNITIKESALENNIARWGGAIGERRSINGNAGITLFNSSFINNTAESGAAIYNDGGSGTYKTTYNITYNTFKYNTADDKETINLGENDGERIITENTYINTDMKINTLNISLKDDITFYIQGEDVTLLFTAELEHPDYYETENPEKLKINKTLYINDKENDTTEMPDYTLSDLLMGEYNVYYIISNQQSNTVTFEVFYYSEISTTETSYEYYRGVDNMIPLVITDTSAQKGMITVAVKEEDEYTTISSYYNVGNGYQLSAESLAKALENLYDTLDSNYTINVTYSNNYVTPSSTEFTLNIIKQRNTSIVYNIINNTEANVQINITVVDAVYNTPISDAVIEVTGDITTTTTSGIVTDTTLVPGDYSINVNYPETDNYKVSEITIDFIVEIDKDKKIQELEEYVENLTSAINNLTEQLGQAQEENENLTNVINNLTEQLTQANDEVNNLTIQLNDAYGDIENLTNTVNNLTQIIQNLTKQIEELTKPPLNTTITINPINSSIGSVTKLIANIVDENNNKVSGGRVIFKINGKTLKDENNNTLYAEVNNGMASINYKVQNIWMKNTTYIEAVYSGTTKFKESRVSATNILNITKGMVTLTLEKTSIIAKAGQTITLRAKVVDSNGVRINGDKVIFKLNGKTLTDSEGNVLYAQVIDGDAILDFTIPATYNAKTYTITAVFGSNYYERTETNGTLTLEKKGITINTDSITTTNNKTTVKATITDETGSLLVSSTKLVFKVNGKTILNNITSNNGIIDISFNNTLKPGLYEFLIISGENGIYKSGKMTTVLKI